MSNTVTATFYAQVEPEWGYGNDGKGNRPVYGAKITRVTQKRPESPLGGTVMLKLAVQIPKAAFLPLQPEATIVIPLDLVETTPIEVEAEVP